MPGNHERDRIKLNHTRGKNYNKIFFVLIILGCVFLYFHGSQNKKQSVLKSSVNELELKVVPLKAQTINISDSYIGYITPINSVDIIPKVSGYIEKVWVKGGHEVKNGENLLLINPNEYKARQDAARAQVLQSKADFDNAKLYYKRLQKAGAKAISKTELDNAKAKYLSSEGAYSQALANYELAKINLDYTLLSSPINGIVGNLELAHGKYVSSSQSLLKIIQYDPIRVVFSITQKSYINLLKHNGDNLLQNDKIKLRLSDGKIYERYGKFMYTANELDQATGSMAIYADFANPDKILVANAYVDVILERNEDNVYKIYQNYVYMSEGKNYVYTIRNNKLYQTPVEIIHTIQDNYVIRADFHQDEYLVTDKIGEIEKNVKIKAKLINRLSYNQESL